MQKNYLDSLPYEKWDALIHSLVRRFTPILKNDSAIDIDDMKQHAWIALIRASNRFDPEKAAAKNIKFTSWAYIHIRGALLRLANNHAEKPRPTAYTSVSSEDSMPIEELAVDDHDYFLEMEQNAVIARIFDCVKEEPHATLLIEYFVLGKTYRVIAKEQGVSFQLIRIRLNKLLDKIKHRIQHENSGIY